MILPRDDRLLAERSWLTSAGKQRWDDRIDEELSSQGMGHHASI
jgi:hypothetical protein